MEGMSLDFGHMLPIDVMSFDACCRPKRGTRILPVYFFTDDVIFNNGMATLCNKVSSSTSVEIVGT